MSTSHSGKCFCGAVEIEVSGTPLEMGFCHCESCRSFSGAPVTAFILWKTEDVRVAKGADQMGAFNKTGMSDRKHCTRCGGHLMTEHPSFGLTDVLAVKLPTLPFEPTVHLHYAQTVLPMRDGIRKLKDFPAEVGGTGEEVAE